MMQYYLTAPGHSYCHSQEFGSVVGAAESASVAVEFRQMFHVVDS